MQQEEIGYIDRIEEGRYAVLLVEALAKEIIVDVSELPEGAKEGTYLKVTLIDGDVQRMTINQKETDKMEQEIKEKLQRIQSRSRKSRFKRE